jgi:hypothetical protein
MKKSRVDFITLPFMFLPEKLLLMSLDNKLAERTDQSHQLSCYHLYPGNQIKKIGPAGPGFEMFLSVYFELESVPVWREGK